MIPKIEAKADIPQLSGRVKVPFLSLRANTGVYRSYRLSCARCLRNPSQCSCARPSGRPRVKLVEAYRFYA